MAKKHVPIRLDDDEISIIEQIQKEIDAVGVKSSKADAVSKALKFYASKNFAAND